MVFTVLLVYVACLATTIAHDSLTTLKVNVYYDHFNVLVIDVLLHNLIFFGTVCGFQVVSTFIYLMCD
jgi:hypothetical protein